MGAKDAIKKMGETIAETGTPKKLGPMVFVFTGATGRVASRALEIFELLPHKYITADQLPGLIKNKNADREVVYGVKVSSKDCMIPNDPGKEYDDEDYRKNPEGYHCIFNEK